MTFDCFRSFILLAPRKDCLNGRPNFRRSFLCLSAHRTTSSYFFYFQLQKWLSTCEVIHFVSNFGFRQEKTLVPFAVGPLVVPTSFSFSYSLVSIHADIRISSSTAPLPGRWIQWSFAWKTFKYICDVEFIYMSDISWNLHFRSRTDWLAWYLNWGMGQPNNILLSPSLCWIGWVKCFAFCLFYFQLS